MRNHREGLRASRVYSKAENTPNNCMETNFIWFGAVKSMIAGNPISLKFWHNQHCPSSYTYIPSISHLETNTIKILNSICLLITTHIAATHCFVLELRGQLKLGLALLSQWWFDLVNMSTGFWLPLTLSTNNTLSSRIVTDEVISKMYMLYSSMKYCVLCQVLLMSVTNDQTSHLYCLVIKLCYWGNGNLVPST